LAGKKLVYCHHYPAFHQTNGGDFGFVSTSVQSETPLVCFDEASYQLLGHTRDPLSVQPGIPAKQDSEYKRNGTRNLFVFVEPKAGRRAVLITRQRKKQDFAHAMRYLVDVLYPDAECIDVVLDNLNTHRHIVLIEIFGKAEADRIMNRLCFHYTPPHGSWLNMAEIQYFKKQISDRETARMGGQTSQIASARKLINVRSLKRDSSK
jgi:hypothetical protein